MAASALPAVSLAQGVPVPPVAAAAAPPASIPAVSGAGLLASFGARVSSLRDELAERVASLDIDGPGGALSLGEDGRLTILLLGSDYRENYRYLEHTDVIMVVSFDMATKELAFASIPRDVVYFQIHTDNRISGATTSGEMRVNLLYDRYRTIDPQQVSKLALEKFKKDVAFALRMEIDYYAFIRFTGFDALMDEVGGVAVNIPARIVDPEYRDSGSPPYGVKFPARSGWMLKGRNVPLCSGTVKNCKRGIVYVRSRKGTVGSVPNTDAQRVGRQQGLVLAAISKVASGGADLGSLLSASDIHVTTSMPTSFDDVSWLRNRLKSATSASSDRVNFLPTAYAKDLTVPRNASRLKNKAVRAWIAQHMD